MEVFRVSRDTRPPVFVPVKVSISTPLARQMILQALDYYGASRRANSPEIRELAAQIRRESSGG